MSVAQRRGPWALRAKKRKKTRAGDFIATPSRSSGDQMRALIKSSAGPVTKLTFQRACAGRRPKPHAVIWRGYKGDRTHARAGAWPHQLWRPRFLALSPPLLRAVHGLLACHVLEARGRHR